MNARKEERIRGHRSRDRQISESSPARQFRFHPQSTPLVHFLCLPFPATIQTNGGIP